MTLDSLLLSQDPELVRVIRPTLEKLSIDVEICHEARAGVLVLVEVDQRIGAEVDRIGAGSPGAIKEIGVKNLEGKHAPSAGRAAVKRARPRFADAAELLLNIRIQLLDERVAVRAEVSRVHGVGIVVVGIGVLRVDDQHARQAAAGPILEKAIGFLVAAATASAASG